MSPKYGRGKKTTADKLKDLKKMSMWRDFSLGAKHEAVIKNDGSKMVLLWKIYMIKFYEKNHF